MKKGILISIFIFHSVFVTGQVLSFDQLSTMGSGKAISWTTSLYGNGFGHRWIGMDPGEFTTLNLQYRHNSTTWNDAMVITTLGRIGIGTSNPAQELDVNGTIRTKEVNVTTAGWADYVFKPDYELKPLSEVERFILENGHLPNTPTEKEVLENGVNLLEMNVKLLEKVEELTLYLFALKKQNDALEAKVELLIESGNNQLK